jgi:hypothetical protein
LKLRSDFCHQGKLCRLLQGFDRVSVQLSAAFFGDLHRVWEVEGLTKMAKSDPIRFCEMVAKLCRVTKLELGPAGSFEQPRTRQEVLDKMEERSGPKGRALLASFLEQMDKMESGGADDS